MVARPALVALALALPLWATAPPRPLIEVVVRFTVKEFDPRGKKAGAMEVVVINHTDRTIKVPVGYARRFDGDVVVYGRVGTNKKIVEKYWFYWDLRLTARTSGGPRAANPNWQTSLPARSRWCSGRT